jgi:hypothetical protein
MYRLEATTDLYRFVSSEDTAIVAWLRAPTLDSVVKLHNFLTELGARKGTICILVCITEGIMDLDATTRQAMAEGLRKTAPFTSLIVAVIEGEGFRTSVLRSIASGMQLVARKTAPIKMTSTIDAGIDALLKHKKLVGALERAEIVAAVRLARTGT